MRLEHHIELLGKPRTLALRERVFRSVKEGDLVLDAGTGSGILAVWAAMAGALNVVAVGREHSGLAMELA
jgi:predicted RNA methylase